MGMRAYLQAVPAAQIETLRADPRAAAHGSSRHAIDVDKAWHGLHWLFNGTAWDVRCVAGEAILGGEPLEALDAEPDEDGDEDDEGGSDAEPPRLFQPARVAAIAQALATLSRAELGSRYDPVAMEAAQIYPDIWVRDGREALDYLMHYHDILATFYAEAARRGDAVLARVA